MEEEKYNELYGIRSRLEKAFPDLFVDYLDSLKVAEYIVAMKTSPDLIQPEDIAWMHWLLSVAMKLFEAYISFQDRGWCNSVEDDKILDEIDNCYICVIDRMKGFYNKYPTLDKNIYSLAHCYTTLSGETYDKEKQWLYGNDERIVITAKIDYMHEIAELKRLCIVNGVLEPIPRNEIEEKIKALAEATIKIVDEVWEKNREIESYSIELTGTGNVVINGVWIIKEKLQKDTRPWKLLTQSFENDGERFTPDRMQGGRKMTQVLEQVNITGPLRQMFFPLVKEGGDILFRSSISGIEAKKEGIDTSEIDKELKKRGGETTVPYNPLLGVRRLNLKGIPTEDQFDFGENNATSFTIDLDTGEGMKELTDSIKESLKKNKDKGTLTGLSEL